MNDSVNKGYVFKFKSKLKESVKLLEERHNLDYSVYKEYYKSIVEDYVNDDNVDVLECDIQMFKFLIYLLFNYSVRIQRLKNTEEETSTLFMSFGNYRMKLYYFSFDGGYVICNAVLNINDTYLLVKSSTGSVIR